MAGLDVSVALTNPYTLDSFNVLRRRQIVNNFGETRVEVFQINGVPGVVYPEGDNSFKRRAEAQVQSKTIAIISRFALRGMSQNCEDGYSYQPDYVIWRGDAYILEMADDYSRYGAGFVKMQGTSIDMVDQSPKPNLVLEYGDSLEGKCPW